jgi:uncharacterized protein (DUF1501 family)
MNRKKFLQISSLATASLLVPKFLYSLNSRNIFTESTGNKKLVIIQLSGGNDGLNTFIPYTNDLYYQSRMGLSYPKSDLITLNDSMGLNPNMKALKVYLKKANVVSSIRLVTQTPTVHTSDQWIFGILQVVVINI